MRWVLLFVVLVVWCTKLKRHIHSFTNRLALYFSDSINQMRYLSLFYLRTNILMCAFLYLFIYCKYLVKNKVFSEFFEWHLAAIDALLLKLRYDFGLFTSPTSPFQPLIHQYVYLFQIYVFGVSMKNHSREVGQQQLRGKILVSVFRHIPSLQRKNRWWNLYWQTTHHCWGILCQGWRQYFWHTKRISELFFFKVVSPLDELPKVEAG